jgi:hypothetical protein
MSRVVAPAPFSPSSYIARETVISMVINTGFSLAFFLLVFRLLPLVPVRGFGAYAFDFLPQSFAIALISTLVPGAIRAAVASGAGRPVGTGLAPAAQSGVAHGGCGLAGDGGRGRTPCGLLLATEMVSMGWWSALIVKLIYGAALAGVITPPTLWAALE